VETGKSFGWVSGPMSRLNELKEELQAVFAGKGASIFDSIFPLFLFISAKPVAGTNLAIWGAITSAGVIAVYRIKQKKSLVYSLGGIAGVLAAALLILWSDSANMIFLPGIISSAVLFAICMISVAFKRPLAAWTSFLTRRWPLNWYWHPQVLPAYTSVTLIWAAAFFIRFAIEFSIFQKEALDTLGTVRLVFGWPYTVALLTASYLYGLWRLGRLQGPSIEEFKNNACPPWEGQKRGF